jgi:hypothetical protein
MLKRTHSINFKRFCTVTCFSRTDPGIITATALPTDMQAIQSLTMVNHPLLAPSDFNSPSCLMWGVLALTALHEDAPPHGDILDDTTQALLYCGAVNQTIKKFSPFFGNFVSTASEAELWDRVGSVNLMVNSAQNYHVLAKTPVDVAFLPMLLCAIFTAFHRQLQVNPVQTQEDPYSADGMEKGIAELMRGLLHGRVKGMLHVIYNQYDPTNPSVFKEEFQNHICRAVEDFVECKMDIKELHGRVPRDSIGQHMVELIRPSLHDHVSEIIGDFFDEMGFGTENTLGEEDSAAVNSCLDILYRNLGRFFSFRSTLLEEFLPEIEENEIPEHVANHDFARYEDNDWFQREYELFDVQDVLRGPEHATLDDVSIPVEAAEDSELTCGLCHDAEVSMREIKVCGHECCAECLNNQLQARHECRYKCALCRAEFFPQELS